MGELLVPALTKGNRLTLEHASIKTLSAIFAFSVIIFIFESIILGGNKSLNSPALRGLVEEIIRLAFVYGAFKAVQLVSTPSIMLSIAEVVFSTLVNWIFYQPEYFTSLNVDFVAAIVSVLSIATTGFIAGMIYLKYHMDGRVIAYGFLFIAPIKIGYYYIVQELDHVNINYVYYTISIFSMFLILVSIAIILYNINLSHRCSSKFNTSIFD